MVFVRKNFFYRKFFIEKNAEKEQTHIYIFEFVLYLHFRFKIINRSALNAGRDFMASQPFSILNKNVKNDILI